MQKTFHVRRSCKISNRRDLISASSENSVHRLARVSTEMLVEQICRVAVNSR
jgi:hypothetical protein